MKIEVGRVYVLINGEGAFESRESTNKPLAVKATRHGMYPFTMIDYAEVVGLEDYDGLPLAQRVYGFQLKPASEKQRVAFNREYFKVLNGYKAMRKEAYWL